MSWLPKECKVSHWKISDKIILIGKFQTKKFNFPNEGVWILKDTRMFFNVLTLRFPSKGAGIVNWLILLFVCVFEGPYSGEQCSPLSFFGDSNK